MHSKRVDDFLLKVLRPKVVGTVTVIVFVGMIAAAIYYAGGEDWSRDLPFLEKRGLFALVAVVAVIAFVVTARRKRRKLDREGVSGVADILRLDSELTDGRYPNGTVNLTVLLRFNDVGAAIEPQEYRIFRVSPRQLEAEGLAAGVRRPIRLLPNDLSVVMLRRQLTEGKPFECHRSAVRPAPADD